MPWWSLFLKSSALAARGTAGADDADADADAVAVDLGADHEQHAGGAAVKKIFSPLCDELTVTPFDCAHYPMQEAPPLLVATVERFLTSATA